MLSLQMHEMHVKLFEKCKLISERKFAVIVKRKQGRSLERISLIACNYFIYISARGRKRKEHTKQGWCSNYTKMIFTNGWILCVAFTLKKKQKTPKLMWSLLKLLVKLVKWLVKMLYPVHYHICMFRWKALYFLMMFIRYVEYELKHNLNYHFMGKMLCYYIVLQPLAHKCSRNK